MMRVSPAPRSRGNSALGLAGAIAAVLVLGGCPGEIDPSLVPGGGGGSGGGACDPTPIFTMKSCSGMTICHDANGSAANFNMASPGWETHLVGVIPKEGGAIPSQCGA